MYFCYYDASYYRETKNGIAAVYIEDDCQKKIFEKQVFFEGKQNSQEAEAFAFEIALDAVKAYPKIRVQLLGDCKPLIESVWDGKGRFEMYRDKMKEMHLSLEQLVWIYREYNKAHGLTQPAHVEPERMIYEIDVRYTLSEHAYEQYKYIRNKQKVKPHILIEKKLNQYIEEAHYFRIQMNECIEVFFRYGFILFTKGEKIIALYKSEDNKNQYGICKKNPRLLEKIFFNVALEKNQA